MWSVVLRQVGTIARAEVAGRNAGHITELLACSDGRVCILMLEACFTCISA